MSHSKYGRRCFFFLFYNLLTCTRVNGLPATNTAHLAELIYDCVTSTCPDSRGGASVGTRYDTYDTGLQDNSGSYACYMKSHIIIGCDHEW